MTRYICDITLAPVELSKSHAASTLMVILHGINKRQSGPLGFSFPQFSEDSLGNIIRLVSYDASQLKGFINNPVIQLLEKNRSVSINSIRENENSGKECCFIRDRRPDRRKMGHWIRSGYSEEEAMEKINLQSEISDPLHFIWMRSKTGHLFKLYIRKEVYTHRQDGAFNSYGLSKAGVTVPI